MSSGGPSATLRMDGLLISAIRHPESAQPVRNKPHIYCSPLVLQFTRGGRDIRTHNLARDRSLGPWDFSDLGGLEHEGTKLLTGNHAGLSLISVQRVAALALLRTLHGRLRCRALAIPAREYGDGANHSQARVADVSDLVSFVGANVNKVASLKTRLI